jgi:hypothetical protein
MVTTLKTMRVNATSNAMEAAMKQQVPGMRIPIGLLFSAFVMLAGCEGHDGDRNGLGEGCGRAADCQDGLLCVDMGCARDANTSTGGVYTDPVTGFEWQQTPSGGNLDWESAVIHCRNLNLNGTGWRLPSISELRSLFRGCPATESEGACEVTDSCLSWDSCMNPACAGCEPDAGPAAGCYWPAELGGSCSPFYWSSSTVESSVDESLDGGAFYVIFSQGHVCARSKDFFFGPVRCVR